jgi:outer membrane biogenesis lipoprotein LolB
MPTRYTLLPLLTAALLCGCSKPAEKPAAKARKQEPSTMKTMIDGVTGAQAVRSGRKASNQIKSLSTERDDQLNDIMNANE